MTDEAPPAGRFSSLAIPEFRRLWWGGVFVFLAMQTQQIARSWLAYELTGTNTALGGVLIGFGIAGLVAIPTGGVLADRFNKRTILVATQLVNTVTAVLIAVAIETDDRGHRVRAIATGDDIRRVTAGLAARQDTPVELWLDIRTAAVVRAEFDTSIDGATTTWVLELDDYGTDVTIEPPDLDG